MRDKMTKRNDLDKLILYIDRHNLFCRTYKDCSRSIKRMFNARFYKFLCTRCYTVTRYKTVVYFRVQFMDHESIKGPRVVSGIKPVVKLRRTKQLDKWINKYYEFDGVPNMYIGWNPKTPTFVRYK